MHQESASTAGHRPAPAYSVVIVAYRSEDAIAACLDSLFADSAATGRCEAVVVDNSPDEGTWEALREYARAHPLRRVLTIRRPDNPGFARGCNLGASVAGGRILVFLNPDACVLPGALDALAARLDGHADIAVAGPQILAPDGSVVPTCRRLPTLWRIFLDATGLDRLVGGYRMLHFDHATARPVDQVIGACFAVRADDYRQRGGFDERFYIYFEEVDYCRRVLQSGGQVWFEPAARVRHAGGASCESAGALEFTTAILRESRTRYFDKHAGPWGRAGIRLLNRCEALAKAAALLALDIAEPNPARAAKARGFIRVARGKWPPHP
ncbi:glycosyltransferase family 2 protein [Nitratidesulfovibrio sp. D1]|uniref:glycosyltransferase family 2 protein n=1 Tax=Nitratidesulfovibrio sp. D1 TaxID=3440151 RepID=UPI003EBBB6B5